MTGDPVEEFEKILKVLKDYGALLVSDSAFPSVTGLIVGKSVRGSWWSHPLAHTIFTANEMLEEHRDVLITKLISGKVTFLHRTMWTHVYAMATASEDWQTRSLSDAAKRLLKKVRNEGTVDTSNLDSVQGLKPGDVARELERGLLIHATQVHTDSGAHAKIIETWDSWANRVGLKNRGTDPQKAKQFLEKRVRELNEKFGARAQLPWQ